MGGGGDLDDLWVTPVLRHRAQWLDWHVALRKRLVEKDLEFVLDFPEDGFAKTAAGLNNTLVSKKAATRPNVLLDVCFVSFLMRRSISPKIWNEALGDDDWPQNMLRRLWRWYKDGAETSKGSPEYRQTLESISTIRIQAHESLGKYTNRFNMYRNKLLKHHDVNLSDLDFLLYYIDGLAGIEEYRDWARRTERAIKYGPVPTLHDAQLDVGGLPQTAPSQRDHKELGGALADRITGPPVGRGRPSSCLHIGHAAAGCYIDNPHKCPHLNHSREHCHFLYPELRLAHQTYRPGRDDRASSVGSFEGGRSPLPHRDQDGGRTRQRAERGQAREDYSSRTAETRASEPNSPRDVGLKGYEPSRTFRDSASMTQRGETVTTRDASSQSRSSQPAKDAQPPRDVAKARRNEPPRRASSAKQPQPEAFIKQENDDAPAGIRIKGTAVPVAAGNSNGSTSGNSIPNISTTELGLAKDGISRISYTQPVEPEFRVGSFLDGLMIELGEGAAETPETAGNESVPTATVQVVARLPPPPANAATVVQPVLTRERAPSPGRKPNVTVRQPIKTGDGAHQGLGATATPSEPAQAPKPLQAAPMQISVASQNEKAGQERPPAVLANKTAVAQVGQTRGIPPPPLAIAGNATPSQPGKTGEGVLPVSTYAVATSQVPPKTSTKPALASTSKAPGKTATDSTTTPTRITTSSPPAKIAHSAASDPPAKPSSSAATAPPPKAATSAATARPLAVIPPTAQATVPVAIAALPQKPTQSSANISASLPAKPQPVSSSHADVVRAQAAASPCQKAPPPIHKAVDVAPGGQAQKTSPPCFLTKGSNSSQAAVSPVVRAPEPRTSPSPIVGFPMAPQQATQARGALPPTGAAGMRTASSSSPIVPHQPQLGDEEYYINDHHANVKRKDRWCDACSSSLHNIDGCWFVFPETAPRGWRAYPNKQKTFDQRKNLPSVREQIQKLRNGIKRARIEKPVAPFNGWSPTQGAATSLALQTAPKGSARTGTTPIIPSSLVSNPSPQGKAAPPAAQAVPRAPVGMSPTAPSPISPEGTLQGDSASSASRAASCVLGGSGSNENAGPGSKRKAACEAAVPAQEQPPKKKKTFNFKDLKAQYTPQQT